jgi:hypothetical protein
MQAVEALATTAQGRAAQVRAGTFPLHRKRWTSARHTADLLSQSKDSASTMTSGSGGVTGMEEKAATEARPAMAMALSIFRRGWVRESSTR